MQWMNRSAERGVRNAEGKKKTRASWAAVALAVCSLFVQVTNFVRTDLKPLLEAMKQNTATLKRIETRLEDHEHRLQVLERQKQ